MKMGACPYWTQPTQNMNRMFESNVQCPFMKEIPMSVFPLPLFYLSLVMIGIYLPLFLVGKIKMYQY